MLSRDRMQEQRGQKLERRVVDAAEAALAQQSCVSAIDVLLGLGWLAPSRFERWRQGRVDDLERTMARAITELYPGCPRERAEAIARHAGARGSGRVGRSAAARALDAEAITLAVVASVRHRDTHYDDLLMSGMDRREARDRVRPEVDRVLAEWTQAIESS